LLCNLGQESFFEGNLEEDNWEDCSDEVSKFAIARGAEELLSENKRVLGDVRPKVVDGGFDEIGERGNFSAELVVVELVQTPEQIEGFILVLPVLTLAQLVCLL